MRHSRPRRPRPTIAVIVAVLFLGLVAGGPVRADTKGDLDQTTQELKAAEAALAQLIDEIADEQKHIDEIQGELSDIVAEKDKVESRIARTQARVVQKQVEILTATDELNATQDQLDTRARLAFESGGGLSIDFLLGSTSLADLAVRLEIVDRATQSDKELINEFNYQRAVLAMRQHDLEALETDLRSDRANLVKQQSNLQDKLAEENDALEKLDADKAEADRQVANLEAQKSSLAKKLAEELAAIEAAKKALGEKISGVFFRCPVDPARVYSDDFGAPRYGGGYHLHAGNDIFADLGTPIRAPFDGTAEDASNGLGGISVKVFGAAGWVYNAHLSEIVQLGPVSTGDIIGLVGNSGDAQGGAYHDHFEWHPNVIPDNPHVSPYGVSVIGDAIDPWPYLNSVC